MVTVFLFGLSAAWLYGVGGVAEQIASMTWRGWLGVLFLAYMAGLAGYAGWGSLLSRYPAGKITPLALFVPVIALMVAYLVLNEPLNTWHWTGSLVVMGALVVQVFGGKWLKK